MKKVGKPHRVPLSRGADDDPALELRSSSSRSLRFLDSLASEKAARSSSLAALMKALRRACRTMATETRLRWTFRELVRHSWCAARAAAPGWRLAHAVGCRGRTVCLRRMPIFSTSAAS